MAHDVFISYSSQDKTVANAVCATLESRKIRCWIAPRDALAGQPYAESILEGINRSRVFVLVFSSDSNISQQVLREVERAVSKGIPILPFRIEDVEPTKSMELFLSATHWLDALTPPMEKHLQELADTLEVLLGTQASQEVEAPPPVKTISKVERKGKNKPLYIIAGIVVVAVIILSIVLTQGGNKDQDGLTSNLTTTKPVTTGTIKPSTTSTTTLPTTTKTPAPTATPTPTPTTSAPAATSTPTPTTSSTGGIIPLKSGESLTSNITYAGEVVWYTFQIDAPDAVHIVLSKGNNSSMAPWLGLLAPDGSIIYEHYGSSYGTLTGDPEQIDLNLTKLGKYLIRVRGAGSTTGAYVLSYFHLSETSNPISSPTSFVGEIGFSGEVDYYTFQIDTPDAVHIVLSKGNNSGIAPWLGLLAPDGSITYEHYGASYGTLTGDPEQIDLTLTKPGKYLIRVRGAGSTTGAYVLSYFHLSETSNPISSPTSFVGEIGFSGEVDYYTFQITTPTVVHIVLSKGNKSDIAPWLGLLAPDGSIISESYGASYGTLTGDPVQIDPTLTKPGKYLIRVRGAGSTTGTYAISFLMTTTP